MTQRIRYFEYGCGVRVVAGHRALERVPEILGDLSARRPMFVTDPGVAASGLLETVRGAMGSAVKIGHVAADVPPDSPKDTVENLATRYREADCDALVALGGGSVIDTVKAVNILVSEGSDDLMIHAGVGRLQKPLKPFVALPTTAGTGSEVTTVSVIKDPIRRIKLFFSSRYLLPDAAVLDPRLTLGLPPAVTAATGMDALTHAIEAYTCMAKNPLSDAAARQAVALIGRHLLPLMTSPGDAQGRLAMAIAASLAGMAFSNSMVGLVHSLGHAVGALCQVPHGNCMAIFLPYGLEYNRHTIEPLLAELLFHFAGPETGSATPPDRRASLFIEKIRQLNHALHLASNGRHPRCLKEITDRDGKPLVTKERFGEIAAAAVNDGSLLWNPEDADWEDCLAILDAAWDGRPLGRRTGSGV